MPRSTVARVQDFYDRSITFKSDFEQRFWVKAYNQEKTSRGHVTFAKPGKMEWVYDDPKDNRVVSDGTCSSRSTKRPTSRCTSSPDRHLAVPGGAVVSHRHRQARRRVRLRSSVRRAS
jgi:hypothetical protein